MSNYDHIREARLVGWTPISPEDLVEYNRALDWEQPNDDLFLEKLDREAQAWLIDNYPDKTRCYWCGAVPACNWRQHWLPDD